MVSVGGILGVWGHTYVGGVRLGGILLTFQTGGIVDRSGWWWWLWKWLTASAGVVDGQPENAEAHLGRGRRR